MSEFGRPRRHYRRSDSTNERARELADAGAPGGTVVTASEQTEGRGRHGRTWVTPPGRALLYSAILRGLGRSHSLLPLAVPLAVCEAIEELAPQRCLVKWPNDVWIEARKVAGVLIEARPQDGWAVIGVGVNISIEPGEFPPELVESATSVGHGASVDQALAALNRRLSHWVDASEEQIREAFTERDALRGQSIEWDGGKGTAEGIDEGGNLLVSTVSGERMTLGAGEVHLRGVSPPD